MLFMWSLSGGYPPSSFCHAIHALSHSKKRAYLADYKPMSELYSPKSITTIVTTAALIPFNRIVHEYNVHLESGLDEDFNWQESLNRHWPMFILYLQKHTIVQIIKKLCQVWAYENLPARLVDKLTKDLHKSLLRKMARYDSLEVARRIFRTALFNSSLLIFANFVYDVGSVLIGDTFSSKPVDKTEDSMRVVVQNRVVLLFKKAGYWAVCLGSSSAGYAIGSYLNPNYGGTVFRFLFELGAALKYTTLVGG